MKNLIKFLSVLAVIYFIALSCKEDIYLHDGEDGKDGKDGVSYVYTFNFIQEGNCLSIEVYENGSLSGASGPFCFVVIPGWHAPSFWYYDEPLDEYCVLRTWYYEIENIEYVAGQDTVCDGRTPVLTSDVIPYGDLCNIWIFYADDYELLRDTVCSGETVVVHDTIKIHTEYFFENCNNPGNSPYYASIGWDLGKGFSINQIGSQEGNGSIVLCKDIEYDTIWSPDLFSEPMWVDSISIPIGALNCYQTSLLLKDVFGDIYVVESATSFIGGFNWQIIVSYNVLSYSVPLDYLEFPNIIKFGLATQKQGNFTPDTRDEKFNADNLFIRGVKIPD